MRASVAQVRAVAAVIVLVLGTGANAKADSPAGASVSDALSEGLTPEQRSELRFLEHLGWRFERDASAKEVSAHAGTPCYRRDLAAAHAGGDLRIVVPKTMGPAETERLGKLLVELPDSIGTRCAFKQKIAVATKEATKKLAAASERGDLTFPKLLFIDSPWFRCTLPEPEWKKIDIESVCAVSPAKGIEAIYTRGGVAECYTGQWIAIFAIQYELYGPAWFDQVFKAEELRLGRPAEAMQMEIGRLADERVSHAWRSLVLTAADEGKDPGLLLAQLGPKAFAGLTGVMQDEYEIIGANQNFTIVSVTPRAVESLKARGGFSAVPQMAREILAARKASLKGISSAERAAHRKRGEDLLADPIFSEILLFVQPYGVVPLAKMADKEMSENGRPVKVRIYTNGVDDFFYQRYRKAWKERWLREQAAAVR